MELVRQISPMVLVQEVCTVEQLQPLAEEWTALVSNSPDATPFQSPEWLIPWWQHWSEGDLWLLAFRENGRLLGIAPFFILRKHLLLMGAGVSDYLDVICESYARPRVMM